METEDLKSTPSASAPKFGRRTWLLLAALGVVAGALIVGAAIANAASTPSPNPTAPAAGQTVDPSKGGHVGANGVVEKLLTGADADKAKAAALAAVPGATIERVETDAEGAVYEAHMVKSDGSHVTVKMDANFKVTVVENGPDRSQGN